MARFCPKCGAQQGDDASFCGNCGTPISAMQAQAPVNPQPEPQVSYTQPQNNYYQPQQNYAQPENEYSQPQASYFSQPEPPKKKGNKKVIGIIIAAVALIAAIVIALFATGVIGGSDKEADEVSNTPEGVAEAFLKSYIACDAKKAASYYPSFITDKYGDDLIDGIEEGIENVESAKEEGYKISYTIGDVYDTDEDDIEDIMDWLDDKFQVDESDITDIKTVAIIIEYIFDGEVDDEMDDRIILIKYKGEWKIVYPEFYLY